MAAIELRGVAKVYPNGHAAVRDLTLQIESGELLVLVGPSGSGKSTLLRLIAGLETPTRGGIFIDGRDATAVPPQARNLAMVFQNYALYPHMTVRGNLAFGLRMRRVSRARIATRVAEVAAMLGIETLLDRKPAQLSGGQRQRVALGRAIVREANAFLLDEPLSNLDPLLRVATRSELALLHRRLGATMVYVTHDQEEAMTLGTRVAVMRDGLIEQLGHPLDLFRTPDNTFVARFIGSPTMNIWPCTYDARTRSLRTRGAASVGPLESPLDVPDGRELLFGVRPHDIEIVPDGNGDGAGRVAIVEPLGAETVIHLEVDGVSNELLRAVVDSDASVKVGERIAYRLRRDRLHLFDVDGQRRIE